MQSSRLEFSSGLILALAFGLAAHASVNAADDALYQALGKKGGIAALVDEFIEIMADNSRVAPMFADTDIAHFREKLIEQICVLSRGPCEYTGDPMTVVHKDMNITEAQFNAVVEDLQEAMTRLKVSEATQNRLLAKLAPMRHDIIYR